MPRDHIGIFLFPFELNKLHEDYVEPVRPGIHVGVKSFANLTTTKGGRMSIRVPYKLIDVKRGDAIRLCFHEASAGPQASAYSDDKVIVLD